MKIRLSPDTDNYFCGCCCDSGCLPVVEGETFCPNCGELIWVVKRAIEQGEFGPDYQLPIRSCPPLPKLRGRWLARLCIRYFPSLVRRWLERRERRADAAMTTILEQLQRCRRRDEFQRLLGPCRYLMNGSGFGWLRKGLVEDSPDVVGHYEVGVCSVDIWFKDDRIQCFSASEKLTSLRMAVSSAEDADDANTAWPQTGVTA